MYKNKTNNLKILLYIVKRVKDSLDKLKKLNVCYHITLNDDYRLK